MPSPGLLLVTILAVLGVGSAWAQGEGSFAAACAADVKQHCEAIKPGARQVSKCLRDNAEKLSPDCKKALAEARGRPGRKN